MNTQANNPNATVDRPHFGENNGLVNGHDYHAQFKDARTVPWDRAGLKITRLRLLSDPGYPEWDVSYCHGYIEATKEPVHVQLPFSQLPKKGYRAEIVKHARRDRVFAKGVGILDNISTLC